MSGTPTTSADTPAALEDWYEDSAPEEWDGEFYDDEDSEYGRATNLFPIWDEGEEGEESDEQDSEDPEADLSGEEDAEEECRAAEQECHDCGWYAAREREEAGKVRVYVELFGRSEETARGDYMDDEIAFYERGFTRPPGKGLTKTERIMAQLVFRHVAPEGGKLNEDQFQAVMELLGLCWTTVEFRQAAAKVANRYWYEEVLKLITIEVTHRDELHQSVAMLAYSRNKYRR